MPRHSNSGACPVCIHTSAADINAAFAAGDGENEIGRRFDIDRAAVRRHSADHLDADVARTRREVIKNGRQDLERSRPPGRKKAPAGTRRARVEYIAGMLARQEYVTSHSCYELAEKWGLKSRTSANYVEHLACEARLLLDVRLDKSRDGVIAEAMVSLQAARKLAFEVGKPGDAVKAVMGILGIAEKYYPGMTSAAEKSEGLMPTVVTIHYASGVTPDGNPPQPPSKPGPPGPLTRQ